MGFDAQSLAATGKRGNRKQAGATSDAKADDVVAQVEATAEAAGQPADATASTDDSAADATEREQAAAVTPATETPATVVIELPIGAVERGFATGRIELRLSPRQAAAMKMLWNTLSSQGSRFAGGRSSHPEGTVVDQPTDGIRWLMDRYADAIEAETGKSLTKDFELIFR